MFKSCNIASFLRLFNFISEYFSEKLPNRVSVSVFPRTLGLLGILGLLGEARKPDWQHGISEPRKATVSGQAMSCAISVFSV